MNITVLSYYFFPEYSGAATQWTNVMKRMMYKYELNFNVISARLNKAYPKKETIDGIKVNRVEISLIDPLLSFWYNASHEIFKYRRSIDIVHANGLKPEHAFPLWVAHKLRKPTVGRLSIANSDINFSKKGRVIGRLHKWLLKRVDKYVAISSALTQEIGHVGLSKNKCELIYNGVDTDNFYQISGNDKAAVKKDLGFGKEKIILYIGVLDRRKGVDVLIPAFSRVAAAHRDARLVLVGPENRDDMNGQFATMIKTMVQKLGLSDVVTFYDRSYDVLSFYHAADLFVLPSRNEGMPNVVLEAMACGLPIVGTQISGTEDLVVHGESGMLVPAGDPKTLGDTIIRLLNSPSLCEKMRINVIKTINDRHDIKNISDCYYKLYDNLIN